MKTLSFSLFALSLLTACGSETKPTATAEGAVKSSPPPSPCVELNGTFSRKETRNGGEDEAVEETLTIRLATKIEGGFYHYDLSGTGRFVAADGQRRELELEGQRGELKLSCDAESVTMELRQEDQPEFSVKYVAVGASQVRVEPSDPEAPAMRGTFTKE